MSTTVETKISRRSVLKWTGAVAGASALVTAASPTPTQAKGDGMPGVDKTVWSACLVNCGSRCPLRLQVKDGVVVRVLPDNSGTDDLGSQQIRACPRGRSARQRLYNPDRLKKPMRRKPGTKRGEGQWEEISWDDALTEVASQLRRVIDKYGNQALYFQYYSGVEGGNFTQSGGFKRLLNTLGGFMDFYGTYSVAQMADAIPAHYGTFSWSNSFDDAKNTRLLVLWSDNSLETRMSGGGWTFILQNIRKRYNVRTIVVDPRYSETAALLADEWIPIRPGTDAALVAAMVHVMIKNNLQDQAFLDKYCSGFDEQHMPAGVPANSSYRAYVEGKGPDGIEKTPEWAAKITGIPARRIVQFAREVATTKPCMIAQGWGTQRQANGESACRAPMLLSNVTGNTGIPGGGSGAQAGNYYLPLAWMDDGENKVEATIPCYLWTDAIDHGEQMTATNAGIRGADKLKTSIKLMINYASNTTINQHADINRTVKLLQDESKCEFMLGIDNHMTPSMRYMDMILPETSWYERADFILGTRGGDTGYLLVPQAAVGPLHECRDGYDICTDLAQRLGVEKEFTLGRTKDDWVKWLMDETRKELPELPSKEELERAGVFRKVRPEGKTTVAYADYRADPVANKLESPSGKIEIFSSAYYERRTWELPEGDRIPALPEHVATWEGAEEAMKDGAKYPLQLIGHHFKGRTHSTFANVPWMAEAHRQKVWINMLDAEKRDIKNDDIVEVFNDRGRISLPAYVTPRIMPGVVSVPQGAWFTPSAEGVDTGGNVNVLTDWRPSPAAKGTSQHTSLVDVKPA